MTGEAALRTRLLLVRHAEPEAWALGRCCGRLDPDLSPAGRQQAERAAAWLGNRQISSVYASTSLRAKETAAPLAAARAVAPELRDDLCEVSFGSLEGVPFEDVRAHHPELFDRWMTRPDAVRFPGGEDWTELRARACAALADIRTLQRDRRRGQERDRVVAVVTHGGVIRAALAEALGLEAAAAFRIALDYAGVSAVDEEGGALTVRFVNRVIAGPI